MPDPDSPVMTTRRSRGISRSMFLRLCSRAPRMTMRSLAMAMTIHFCRRYRRTQPRGPSWSSRAGQPVGRSGSRTGPPSKPGGSGALAEGGRRERRSQATRKWTGAATAAGAATMALPQPPTRTAGLATPPMATSTKTASADGGACRRASRGRALAPAGQHGRRSKRGRRQGQRRDENHPGGHRSQPRQDRRRPRRGREPGVAPIPRLPPLPGRGDLGGPRPQPRLRLPPGHRTRARPAGAPTPLLPACSSGARRPPPRRLHRRRSRVPARRRRDSTPQRAPSRRSPALPPAGRHARLIAPPSPGVQRSTARR